MSENTNSIDLWKNSKIQIHLFAYSRYSFPTLQEKNIGPVTKEIVEDRSLANHTTAVGLFRLFVEHLRLR